MEKYLYQDLYHLEDQHWWHQAKRQLVVEAILRAFPQLKTKKNLSKKLQILDLGCGTGKNVEVLQQFGDVIGVDGEPEALRFCKQRGLKNIQLADAQKKLPFKNDSFDVVTLLDVLEHIDEEPVLSEVWRILKPGGVLVVTVPALPWLWSKWDEVLYHKRRYTKYSLRTAVEKHPFLFRHISYAYSFLVLPVVLIRFIKSLVSQKEYTSDFTLNSSLVNEIFKKVSAVERWLVWRIGVPFGTSVFATAQKVKDD